MTFLQKLTPINLLEEKEKFLKDNSYNPQFIYSEEIPEEKLYQYGKPQQKYLALAQEILDKAYFGRNEADLLMMEGKELSETEVEEKIKSFLDMHNLNDRYDIIWSNTYVSRTSITKNNIKLRLPADFRKEGLLGMLYHEIGTHALRRVNYEKQTWFNKKKELGFHDYLKTEEGLAVLHSLIPQSFKLAHKTSKYYLASYHAQKSSFSELWKQMAPFTQNIEKKWALCFRQKRGLKDSSLPGGYSKDLVYFEGMIKTWKYLEKNNFDISGLYYGKIALEDVKKALELSPNFNPILPSFFSTNIEKYKKELAIIGQENFIEQIKI